MSEFEGKVVPYKVTKYRRTKALKKRREGLLVSG